MTDDDKFFERLRADARTLRHQPDERTLARIRTRIHAQINDQLAPMPTVVELLAAWFRPLAMTAVAIALAAGIGVMTLERNDVTFGDEAIEVTVEGETFRVAD
jgi:beta-phosphoglucomutase-like phosphatase (HAD superfamily)